MLLEVGGSFLLVTKDAEVMRIGGNEVKKSRGRGRSRQCKDREKIEWLQFRSFALLMLSFGR